MRLLPLPNLFAWGAKLMPSTPRLISSLRPVQPVRAHLPTLVLAACLANSRAFSAQNPRFPSRYPIGYDPDNRSRPTWFPDNSPPYNSFPAEEILKTRPQYPPLPRPWRQYNSSARGERDDGFTGYDNRFSDQRQYPEHPTPPNSPAPSVARDASKWQPPEGYVPQRLRRHKHYDPRRPPTLPRTTNGPDATWNDHIPGEHTVREPSPEAGAPVPAWRIVDDGDQSPCALAGCTPDDGRIHLCTGIWMGRKILQRRCLRLDP